ncbi:MAG: HEAT repeat domain-containing protein [Chloroflexota bacterium]|nr:HEAT repeat domain-containing protein [Chloroflexota bacterium]
MPPRHSEEEQADFARALVSVAEQGLLSQPEIDSLSMLEGADLQRLREAWAPLPAGARARLIVALRAAAEQRLRLDFSAINQLALDDADPQVRLAGLQSALEDRSPALLKKLLALVSSDPSVEVRFAAAEDLARFTLLAELDDLEPDMTAELKNTLLSVVRDENQAARVRGSALAALGYFSDVDSAKQVAAGFGDPVLRLGAVRAMGRTADPRWTDRLMPVLGSDDPQLRVEAARALGEIEDERGVTPLVELLEDPEPDVQLAVIQALGQIGGEDAREALLFLAEAAEDRIREAADKALEEIEAAEADPMDL